MFPAREVVRNAALESDSGGMDPLAIAMEVGEVRTREWRKVGTLGELTVYSIGEPVRRVILCFDSASERRCLCVTADGLRQAVIFGRRVQSFTDAAGNNVVDRTIDAASSAVDRIFGGE